MLLAISYHINMKLLMTIQSCSINLRSIDKELHHHDVFETFNGDGISLDAECEASYPTNPPTCAPNMTGGGLAQTEVIHHGRQVAAQCRTAAILSAIP